MNIAPYPQYDGTQLCATSDPEQFFPEQGEGVAFAKAQCRRCDFLEPCNAYALTTNVEGVWGGTGTQDRKHIRKELGIVPAPLLPLPGVENAATVAELTEQGRTAREIAAHLGLSKKRVEAIRAAIRRVA